MANKKTIITIGRQFGSGGHEIGATIAQDLGINLYDKEMLKRAAKESGLCEELFETHDEKPTYSFLYSLVMDSYSAATHNGMPLNHQLFLEQYNTIKKLAEENSCVLIGRCADYALADNPDAIHIFIYADFDERVRRISRMYDMTISEAKDIIKKNDKKRASYYNYYTNKVWGDAKSYDLCIDSSKLGIGGTAKAIEDYVKLKQKIEKPRI
jgi:cytidylate kinase